MIDRNDYPHPVSELLDHDLLEGVMTAPLQRGAIRVKAKPEIT